MRTALNAITDELRRLKTAGVKTITVSDESLSVLRKVIAERNLARGSVEKPGLPAALPVSRPAPAAAQPPPPARIVAAAPAMALSAAPIVTLPAGEKTVRWEALRELVREDATCRAAHLPGRWRPAAPFRAMPPNAPSFRPPEA